MAAIQLISKTDYTDHAIVSLPSVPSAPLTTPSTVRIRSRILALTTNTFTYAKRGGAGIPGLDWWNAWPIPSTLAAPFNDTSKYCRISAWGYSEVVESTIPTLPVGTFLHGYQPIGTATEELHLAAADGVPGGWLEVSERRKGLLRSYNLYVATEEDDRESRGWDALMQPLFGASWMLSRFVFDWTGEWAMHPLGMDLPWSREDADLRGAVVILLAPSGKTGLGFAQQLRRGRPEGEQPAKVVAVGSEKSRGFTVGTGLFDEVLGYEDMDASGLLDGNPKKVVLVNFGARGNAADKWAKALQPKCERLQVIIVGADPSAKGPSELSSLAFQPSSGVFQSNAGGQRERAVLTLGAEKYTEELAVAWKAFKAEGGIKGLNLVWGRGIEGFKEGWDGLAGGKFGSDVGLVYELS